MKRTLLLLLLAYPLITYSQQRNTHSLFWLRLAANDTIGKNFKWEFAYQNRTQNNYSGDPNIFHSFQFESYMLTFQYALSRDVKLVVSPAGFFRSHMLNNQESDVARPSTKEFRWSARVDHETKGRYFTYSNRYTIEYRWRNFQIDQGYNGNWRLRYMIKFDKPVLGILSSTKPVIFTIFDEVFFQFGHTVRNNRTVFDQNRLFVGAAYDIFLNTKFTLGYAYGFQIKSQGDQQDNINSYYVGLTFDNFLRQFAKTKYKMKRTS